MNCTPFTLKEDTEILSIQSEYGREIQFVDDNPCDGQIWIYSDCPYGSTTAIVACDGYENAHEALMDELPTIAVEDIPEAYGFYGDDAQARFDAQGEEDSDKLELVEGYVFQSNSTGTGIVSTGHYENLTVLTVERIRESGLQIKIGVIDNY